MDNRSKVIGVAVVVAVVVSIIVVTLLVRNKNLYASCQFGETAPKAEQTNEVFEADAALLSFNGYVEYPAESEKDKPTFVKLAPNSIALSNNVLEIQADCGKLKMTLKEGDVKSVEKIELESAGKDGKAKTCGLTGTNFFSVPKAKHYKCSQEKVYNCEGDKNVPKLHIFSIEFETNRPKEAKAKDFSTQPEECK